MPIAYWCVLVAGILPVLTVGLAKYGGPIDNNHPRDQAETYQGYRRRAYAAHQNGYEAFPLFAVAVLVAESQGGAGELLDGLAIAFVLARLAYIACYVLDAAVLRSIAWSVGFLASIVIFCLPLLIG